jgi:hypothetical protein
MKWAVNAAGNSVSKAEGSPGNVWQSKLRSVYASGTFGGASIQLQASPDSEELSDALSRWFDVNGAVFTDAAFANIEVRARKWRLVTTGGVGTDVVVEIV